jgi:hypothetical protein
MSPLQRAFLYQFVTAANEVSFKILGLKPIDFYSTSVWSIFRDALARPVEASFTSESTIPVTNRGGAEWQALTIFSRYASNRMDLAFECYAVPNNIITETRSRSRERQAQTRTTEP